jgi:hypothetical protein
MTMRLSEAIRWGSRRAAQTRGRLHDPRTQSTCALGAAAAAMGAYEPDLPIDRLTILSRMRELFPILRATLAPGGETVEKAIAALNDRHGLTREQIASRVADWEHALGFAPRAAAAEPPAIPGVRAA